MPRIPRSPRVPQNTKRSMHRALATLGLSAVVGVSLLSGVAGAAKSPPPPPSPASVTWTGGGSVLDGATRTLKTVSCDNSNTPYLSWVLSGSKATSASILIPGQASQSMGKPQVDKQGWSTFKYTWSPGSPIDLNTLYNAVTATYNDGKNKATLTIGQGCLGSGGGGTTTTTSSTTTSTTSSTTTSTTTPTTTSTSTTTSTTSTTTTVPAGAPEITQLEVVLINTGDDDYVSYEPGIRVTYTPDSSGLEVLAYQAEVVLDGVETVFGAESCSGSVCSRDLLFEGYGDYAIRVRAFGFLNSVFTYGEWSEPGYITVRPT
jgi:hypothetical protein